MATLAQAPDSQQADAGKVVKFGVGQFGNPTPKLATDLNRILIALITFYGLIIVKTHNSIIPQHFQDTANIYLLVVPGLSTFFKNAFGWTTPNN